MFGLIPKEESFFELFERSARNCDEAAKAFQGLLDAWGDGEAAREERVRKIKDLEHVGDQVTHETIERLNRMFITPIDREDIHELVCRLDDIVDLIDTAAHRMLLYRVSGPTEDCRKMTAALCHSTAVIAEAMPLMRDMKNAKTLRERVVAIHTQENAADQVLSHALAALFSQETDAREILKWKDLYQEIESATDRCEDVANVLDAIVMKNA
ncbi:MAG: hypothetical protein HMLKMBBP_02634 [Planctomycetes bacterium]|nr:hypothetical protein [Planctomycetota bacterium]